MEYLIWQQKSSMPQKPQPFKSEKKKVQDWVRRQFSRKMSEDSTSNNEIEQVAAVAAAAYAINAVQESSFPDKVKSNKQDTSILMQEPDSKVPVTAATEEKEPEETIRPRSMRKTPTFADTKPASDPGTSLKPITPVEPIAFARPRAPVPRRQLPTTLKPRTPSIQTRRQSSARAGTGETIADAWERRQSSARAGTGETIADAWERKEIAKINKRYGKLKDEILSWEGKKKTKAKRRLNKNEQELEQRRLKAQRNFQNKIEYIEKIAGGARAQADEKRRNEEFKVKHKVDKIRTTGKTPATCFCC